MRMYSDVLAGRWGALDGEGGGGVTATTVDNSGHKCIGHYCLLCYWPVCLSVLGKLSNFFLQYKVAAVRAVIYIMYGSKEGVQGSLLVHQYIVP